jgi:bifunctional DNA-binding transcriptional regulator/antitoxin component of YhaV-PrlF toxin-antitoxin module
LIVMTPASRHQQLAVPVAVLRAAGLKPGDVVATRRTAPGRVELVRDDPRAGQPATTDPTAYPPGYLDELRAGWA